MKDGRKESVTGFRVVAWLSAISTLAQLARAASSALAGGPVIDVPRHASILEPVFGIIVGALVVAAIRFAIAEKTRRGKPTRFVVDRQFLIIFSFGVASYAVLLLVHLTSQASARHAEGILTVVNALCLLPFSIAWIWEVEQHLRRERRRAVGSCIACGYDVRASPDRCPECGTKTDGA